MDRPLNRISQGRISETSFIYLPQGDGVALQTYETLERSHNCIILSLKIQRDA
jgi:hypothetical protein